MFLEIKQICDIGTVVFDTIVRFIETFQAKETMDKHMLMHSDNVNYFVCSEVKTSAPGRNFYEGGTDKVTCRGQPAVKDRGIYSGLVYAGI